MKPGTARKVLAATNFTSSAAGRLRCSTASWAGVSSASALSSMAKPSSAQLIFFHGSQVVVAFMLVAAPA